MNEKKNNKFLKFQSKSLIIYIYSLSNNLIKEILLKMRINFMVTNDIRKASLIIGLKKHLKKNLRLLSFSKRKNILVYSINQISYYQLRKLIDYI